ncbi:MAG TPA: Wzz/FepE/Etk N-terminal domain-containing protein [Verrucomicrobiae bacterium]|nr:Wzz/FepE/Etk N-terminal domain-containing protein [Verrucomicrobiae bacterium]
MLGQRQLTIEDYTAIARRRKWLIIIPVILGPIAGYSLARILPSKYTSQTMVLVEMPTVDQKLVPTLGAGDLTARLETMKEQILSRSRLEPVIEELGLYKKDRPRVAMEDLVGRLRKSIEVTVVQSASGSSNNEIPGFQVRVTYSDARLAQAICANVTSMFMQENLRLQQANAQNTTDFLSKQLSDAKANLDKQDSALAEFERRNIGILPDDQQANLSLLTGLNSQLEATTQALSRAQQDKSFAETNLEAQLSAWQASQVGHDPQTLDKELELKQSQLTDLRSRYTDDYPDVVKLKKEIADLQEQLASEPNSAAAPKKTAAAGVEPPQIQQLRAQVHQAVLNIQTMTAQQQDIQQQIKLYQGRVQLSPAVEEEYKELTRDHQTALDMYNDLLKKKSESAMGTALLERQEGEQFRVLDAPNLPDIPSFPDKRLFTLGGLAGGFALGIGLALLMELRDASLRTERDVEFVMKFPVLAIVPAVEPLTSKRPARGGEALLPPGRAGARN